MVVDYIRRNRRTSKTALACVYFNYKDHAAHSPQDVIGAILKQLVESRPDLSQDIEQAYSQHSSGRSRLTKAETSALLQSELSQLTRVYIIVDALDESSEANGARREVVSELRRLGSIASIFITSRDLPSIQQHFQGSLRLEIRADDEDVRTYIRGRLESGQSLAHHIRAEPALATVIEEAIINNVKGM